MGYHPVGCVQHEDIEKVWIHPFLGEHHIEQVRLIVCCEVALGAGGDALAIVRPGSRSGG